MIDLEQQGNVMFTIVIENTERTVYVLLKAEVEKEKFIVMTWFIHCYWNMQKNRIKKKGNENGYKKRYL